MRRLILHPGDKVSGSPDSRIREFAGEPICGLMRPLPFMGFFSWTNSLRTDGCLVRWYPLLSSFKRYIRGCRSAFVTKITRGGREAPAERIYNFNHGSAGESKKTTVNCFLKQKIPRRTVYDMLGKYLTYAIKKDRPRSGRPLKLFGQKLTAIVRSVINRCGLSRRKIARLFQVHQWTISHNLRRQTSVVTRKRREASKIDSIDQEIRAQKNRGKLYRKLMDGCDLILDNEK